MVVLNELKRLENEQHIIEAFLNKLGGLDRVREIETKKSVKRAGEPRRPTRRGGPDAILGLLKPLNENFTVDKVMELVQKHKLDYNHTDVQNYIQALLKRKELAIIESGRGRHKAVYAVNPKSPKSTKKETAATG